MVFTRSMKTDIKRILTKAFFVIALVLIAITTLFNAVFAKTGMDIPVTVSWNDQSSSSRPSSVTLRLMNGSTEVSNITLTSANQSQSDSNKWEGVFESVPYNANYTVVEDTVSGYSITTNNVAVSYSSTDTTLLENSDVGSGTNTIDLGEVNVIWGRQRGTFYLWTLEEYTGDKYTQLINALAQITLPAGGGGGGGGSGSQTITTSARYYHGLPATFSSGNSTYGTIGGTETNVTFRRGSSSSFSAALKKGVIVPAVADTVTVTNVQNVTTYTLTYEFTGDVLPPNASQLLPAAEEYDDGTDVTVASEPTAQGYRFLGWKKDGQSISGIFTMPSQNVTISGSWERFNGYFAPSISKQITNQQNIYRYGDTVEFQIYVTNTASFPITNVEVTENLVGARFLSSSNYTLISDTVANIASIPAGGTVVLYAEYDIAEDVTQTLTNSAEITAASADNYYFLDTNQSYIASVQFDTQSWQDVPVLTGVKTNSTIFYFILMFLGAVGIGGSIVVHQANNIKEREK